MRRMRRRAPPPCQTGSGIAIAQRAVNKVMARIRHSDSEHSASAAATAWVSLEEADSAQRWAKPISAPGDLIMAEIPSSRGRITARGEIPNNHGRYCGGNRRKSVEKMAIWQVMPANFRLSSETESAAPADSGANFVMVRSPRDEAIQPLLGDLGCSRSDGASRRPPLAMKTSNSVCRFRTAHASAAKSR
ncbi:MULTISPECIES: hypothetical protein [Rhodopseudomonas]|uniref:hypothetical protein n=1 Tax=Rhodopseudomonas TaxID=1073 RepID=UPI000A4E5271|nr:MULTISPECIES: hypothetical protein [Rhodopseudomonas]WOK15524.1 hypothetical protein RBJ75_15140 [Rhodopseudomonas sp. BAL398]